MQIFALSLSAPFIPLAFKEPLDRTAPFWDYVIGNETEAQAYADAHNLGTTDMSAIARHLADLPKRNTQRPRVAVVTQGSGPTLVATQGVAGVQSFPVHALGDDEIVDSSGAGDAFAGGFLAGVVRGEVLARCVDQGQWLAALCLRELGPSYASPVRPRVQRADVDVPQVSVSEADLRVMALRQRLAFGGLRGG